MLVHWDVNSWPSVTHKSHELWSFMNNYDSTVLSIPFVIPHNTYKATQIFIYTLIQRLSKKVNCALATLYFSPLFFYIQIPLTRQANKKIIPRFLNKKTQNTHKY